MTLQFKQAILMVCYQVDLTSVYGFMVGQFILTCVCKCLSSLKVAILYFSFKHKRKRLLFGLLEQHILIIFHVIFDITGYKQKPSLGSFRKIFKEHFRNHKKSFNHSKYKNDMEVSKKFPKSKHVMKHLKLNGK